MLTFNQFIIESTYIDQYQGIKLFLTSHALDRWIERGEVLTKDDLKIIFHRIVDQFKTHIFQDVFLKNYETFLAYSKEYQRAIVFHYRTPKYTNTTEKHFFVITVLPEKKHQVKPGSQTMKMIIEGREPSSEDNDIQEYFSSFITEEDRQDSINYAFHQVPITEDLHLFLVNGHIQATDFNFLTI